MDKWILNPYEIDFGAGGATLVNTGAPTPYKVENAVYSNGDLKFYVNDTVASKRPFKRTMSYNYSVGGTRTLCLILYMREPNTYTFQF